MAYAAVISLKHTIQRLENPINKPHITKSTYKELDSLRSMLKRLDDESSIMIDRSAINELDAKLTEALWKLEDVLESYQYSLNISPSQGDGEKSCCLGPLVNEMEMEMDLFLKTVKKLREEYYRVIQNPLPAEEDEALSAAVPPVNQSTTVGLSDLSHKIRDQILDHEVIGTGLGPAIVSLVGMGGIGKTHLAALIYQHSRIVQDFEVRVWVRVGPKYQVNNIFTDILAQLLHKPRDLFKGKSERKLRGLVQNCLNSTRRYLIVLDDVWTTLVFDYVRLLDDIDDSRLLITTRLQEVAEYRNATIHQMPFLNNEESWNLLWQNVFVAEKSFPLQLEEAGRKIAEKCEGLPLLILAVANILCGFDKTEEYWMKVADKKTTTFEDAYDNIYEVLLPSYEYLSQHLKACFLYMGVFPQSFEIPLSKLINLWILEDFLEPGLFENLEKFSVESIEGLVSRSLVIVCQWSSKSVRRIKSSKLHSVYWYLCVTEAGKNRLFHVLNKLTDVISIERPRRLAVQNNILLGIKEVYDTMAAATSTTRSLLCTGEDHQYPVRICFNMMLMMRVLDALSIRFYEFPNEVLKLLQLQYLSLTHNGELPSSINKLQQLQCLILRRHHNIKFPTAPRTFLPEEIWDIKELRHLWIIGSNLPDPIKGAELSKLIRLYVNANSCSEAVFRSIPNLKILGITIELEPDAAETIRCLEHTELLNELESVKCVVVNPVLRFQLVVAPPKDLSNLPWYLEKLSLNGFGYSWKDMSAIGSMPYLKVLKLRCSAFQGPHWETVDGEFLRLEYLLLEDIDLVNWTAQRSNNDNYFPNLRHLIVRHCYRLKKIPSEIGDIPCLKMMEIDDCSPSVVASALQIKDRSKPSDLQVVINSSWT